jgi:protein-S-isoprenylcysteine O-methyltransferase Ste14
MGTAMPLLRSLIYAVLFVGTLAVLIPGWIVGARGTDLGAAALARWPSLLLLVPGALLCAWCVWDFSGAGRGTPAPFDPPRRLVVRGPYRFVRNPMYIGFLLVLVGEAALTASAGLLAYSTVVALALHVFVVSYEERALLRRFGESYQRYCHHVRRWLPGSPWHGEGP